MMTQTAELLVSGTVHDRHAEAARQRTATAARQATAAPRSRPGAWRRAGFVASFRRATAPATPVAIVPASADC